MLREPAQPIFVFDEAEVKMYFCGDEPETAIEHLERARLEDMARGPLLAQVVDYMRRAGESPVRISVVEFGRILTNAKARLLGRPISQLKRQVKSSRRGSAPSGQLRAISGGK